MSNKINERNIRKEEYVRTVLDGDNIYFYLDIDKREILNEDIYNKYQTEIIIDAIKLSFFIEQFEDENNKTTDKNIINFNNKIIKKYKTIIRKLHKFNNFKLFYKINYIKYMI